MSKPKILAFDIETAPIIADVWQLYDVNVGLNQIREDWSVIAWSAKWLGSKSIKYSDVSKQSDFRKDKTILKELYDLIESADILLSQNGVSFDIKKLNARFIHHGFKPLAVKPHIDTKRLAKKQFGFTSNSLEYLCKILNVKHKKMVHRHFSGHDLWRECLSGNKSAWREMKAYNVRDVVALEEVYKKLAPWGINVNLSVFTKNGEVLCSCGSSDIMKNGTVHTNAGRFQRYCCNVCGAKFKGKKNLIPADVRKGMKVRC